jgi:hypothetical protein
VEIQEQESRSGSETFLLSSFIFLEQSFRDKQDNDKSEFRRKGNNTGKPESTGVLDQ